MANTIIDLPFLKQIASAMGERIKEAEGAYQRLERELLSISTANWDDSKRKEYTQVIAETKANVVRSINEMKDYLAYLHTKINLLENRQ